MRPKEDPHTRDCEGCDVAGSNGEHQGPKEAQWSKSIEEKSIRSSARSAPRICTPRTRPKRNAKKAKEEAVKNVAQSMHDCTSSENDKISPVKSYRNNDSPNDHRDKGRDKGVQELEFLCVGRRRP